MLQYVCMTFRVTVNSIYMTFREICIRFHIVYDGDELLTIMMTSLLN